MPTAADSFDLRWPLDPVLDFLRLLWTVEHRLERGSKRMATRLGVTGPQRFVLRVVQKFPDISAGELARIVQLHPSTVTGILRRLERKRLLSRTADPADQRRALLRVRESARRLTRSPAGTVEAGVIEVLNTVSPRAIDGAREVLRALAGVLDASQTRSASMKSPRPKGRNRSQARPSIRVG